jgi:hypothetical protein
VIENTHAGVKEKLLTTTERGQHKGDDQMTTPEFGQLMRKECSRYDGCKKVGALFYEDFDSSASLINAIIKTCLACEERLLHKSGEPSPELSIPVGS